MKNKNLLYCFPHQVKSKKLVFKNPESGADDTSLEKLDPSDSIKLQESPDSKKQRAQKLIDASTEVKMLLVKLLEKSPDNGINELIADLESGTKELKNCPPDDNDRFRNAYFKLAGLKSKAHREWETKNKSRLERQAKSKCAEAIRYFKSDAVKEKNKDSLKIVITDYMNGFLSGLEKEELETVKGMLFQYTANNDGSTRPYDSFPSGYPIEIILDPPRIDIRIIKD